MNLNATTKLFSEISPEDRKSMLEWCESVILKGEIPSPDPRWLEWYLNALSFDPAQRLLILSTVVPQHILLSILLDEKNHGQ